MAKSTISYIIESCGQSGRAGIVQRVLWSELVSRYSRNWSLVVGVDEPVESYWESSTPAPAVGLATIHQCQAGAGRIDRRQKGSRARHHHSDCTPLAAGRRYIRHRTRPGRPRAIAVTVIVTAPDISHGRPMTRHFTGRYTALGEMGIGHAFINRHISGTLRTQCLGQKGKPRSAVCWKLWAG